MVILPFHARSLLNDMSSTCSYVDDRNVVLDGNLITSRGPATAFEFALKISEQLVGLEKAQEVAKLLLIPGN